jgi:hypothetical protein
VTAGGAVERSRRLQLAFACLLLTLGIWCNTGTLAPLGATLEHPFVWEPCGYLLNIDHFHYKASFLMLDGAPREQWEFSVALRRILYFLVAYPFMKIAGFGGGGLVTNVLISCAALVVFWRELQRRVGAPLPSAVLWLLSTYPGWVYWTGTPYSYAVIVPASLLCMTLLWRLEDSSTRREVVGAGLGLGVLFTGYDLLPLYGGAALVLLAWRRRWADALVVGVVQLLPTLVVNGVLALAFQVPFRNANTEAYWRIVGSYLPPYDGTGWLRLLAQLPRVGFDAFVYGNFAFVPLLAVATAIAWRWRREPVPLLGRAELSLLALAVSLFLFNNAAPPYPGWQLRGSWITRLYQPILPVLLAAAAAALARRDVLPTWPRRALVASWSVALALDAWVVFGPVLGAASLSGALDYRFYGHAPRPMLVENVRRYGARPIGFCSTAPSATANATH